MMLMLRKVTKSHQKDEHMKRRSDLSGVLVGFNPKNSESDSEPSPTSPFDLGIFSSNAFRHPRSENQGWYQKKWKCGKVGLSLVYSLDDDESSGTGNILHSTSLKIVPASVVEEPKPANVGVKESNVIFEIGEALVVPDTRPLNFGTGFVGSVLASEIELSEDYTCVTVHGPNPKVTHIFGDHILGQENGFLTYFLSNCYACQKKLDGEDIYMYRDEAFCSNSCRSREIEIDDEMEKNNQCSSETSDMSNSSGECDTSNLFVTT